MVGGQDELIFDGNSVIFENQSGNLIAHARHCTEDLLLADLDVEAVFRTRLHNHAAAKSAWSLPTRGRCRTFW